MGFVWVEVVRLGVFWVGVVMVGMVLEPSDNNFCQIFNSSHLLVTVKPRNARTFHSSKSACTTVGQIRSYDAHILFKAFFFKA